MLNHICIYGVEDVNIDIGLECIDNIIKRKRTDGLFWTIEIDSRYNILNHTYKDPVKLWKMGVKVGLYYQFDWYHYRGWDNNY